MSINNSSRKQRRSANDFLVGDGAAGFDPAELMTEPQTISTTEIFERRAEAEAVRQTGTYCNCLGTKCQAECPICLIEVELDRDGNCPECGNYLGCKSCPEHGKCCGCHPPKVDVYFVEYENVPAPVRKIA